MHEITAPAKSVAATEVEEDAEPQDETYEIVEMQVTSSAKTRYASATAQTPQEGIVTQPMDSEANKDSAAQEEDQEAYINFE